jgi:hypothetical protein
MNCLFCLLFLRFVFCCVNVVVYSICIVESRVGDEYFVYAFVFVYVVVVVVWFKEDLLFKKKC